MTGFTFKLELADGSLVGLARNREPENVARRAEFLEPLRMRGAQPVPVRGPPGANGYAPDLSMRTAVATA
jgi:hypothetical protein